MLKFLKSLIGSAPEKQVSLTFEEVPLWLDDREKAARDAVSGEYRSRFTLYEMPPRTSS